MLAHHTLKRQVAEAGQKTDSGKENTALQQVTDFGGILHAVMAIPFRGREPVQKHLWQFDCPGAFPMNPAVRVTITVFIKSCALTARKLCRLRFRNLNRQLRRERAWDAS